MENVDRISLGEWAVILITALFVWGMGYATGHWVGREVCETNQVYVVDTGECVAEDDHLEHVGE